MEILDIHTHRPAQEPSQAIISRAPLEFSPLPGHYYSAGYHPWYLSPTSNDNWPLLNDIATHPQVLAIGEAGLDKVKGAEYHLQEKAFEKQICIAILVRKPLIIHSVRTYNEIIWFYKSFKPDNPWIIHGFRGKKELAWQLLDHGMYLSFGEMYQEETLQSIPLDRLFLETDESNVPIQMLYKKAAHYLKMDEEELTGVVQANIREVFFQSFFNRNNASR